MPRAAVCRIVGIMSGRSKIAIGSCVALAVVGAFLPSTRPQGSIYEGRTMEEWFRILVRERANMTVSQFSFPKEYHKAEAAFASYGTNAAPFLAKRIQQPGDSTPKAWWISTHRKLPGAIRSAVSKPISADAERQLAGELLGNAHPPGGVLLALLEPALAAKDASQRQSVIMALGGGGENKELVVPALVKGLADPDPGVRSGAVIALGRLGPAAVPAVPDLLKFAQGTNTVPHHLLARTFGWIGPGATAAIPYLRNLLAGEASEARRVHIAQAIARIDARQSEVPGRVRPHPATIASELTTGLPQTNAAARQAAGKR